MIKKFLFVFLFVSSFVFSQSLYKTPSGEKYHLGNCHTVKNVSEKISPSQISHLHLQPCKICKPPIVTVQKVYSTRKNKAVGESKTQRCRGTTKRGTRCKHRTSIANGYCFQHTKQKN